MLLSVKVLHYDEKVSIIWKRTDKAKRFIPKDSGNNTGTTGNETGTHLADSRYAGSTSPAYICRFALWEHPRGKLFCANMRKCMDTKVKNLLGIQNKFRQFCVI